MKIEEKDDTILPEGIEEVEDIFELADKEEPLTIEESEEAEENDDPREEEDPDKEEEEEDPAPTTEPEPAPPASKGKIKVKFNHEERELDEDEAARLAQIGLNSEKIASRAKSLEARLNQAEKLAKQMGFSSAEEMITAAEANFIEQKVMQLVDEGVHEAIARDLVQRELERNQAQETKLFEEETEKGNERDKDLDEFVRLNPGVTKLPDEVLEAVRTGVPLTVAYERFKNKQAQDELKILKQNQSAAAKAPVGSVTKHGSAKTKVKDDFEKGFDSDEW